MDEITGTSRKSKRIQWADRLKGLMILLTVIHHCLHANPDHPDTEAFVTAYHFFYLSFFSYVFFGISGFLYSLRVGSRSGFKALLRRGLGLLVPTLFVSFTAVLLFSGCGFPSEELPFVFEAERFHSVGELIRLTLQTAESIWFVWVLGGIYIFQFILEHFTDKIRIWMLITILLYVISFPLHSAVIGRFALSYCSFLIGIALGRNREKLNGSRKNILAVILFLTLYLAYSITIYSVFGYDAVSDVLLKMPMAITSELFFLILYAVRMDRRNWLCQIGRYSLPIYLIHWVSCSLIWDLLSQLTGEQNKINLLLSFVVSGICVIIPVAIVKIFSCIPILKYVFSFTAGFDKIDSHFKKR